MRVLVTGGAGWIGQATVRRLEALGHDPVVFDLPGADIRDLARVDVAVADVEHVIHLAGVLGTHELFADPGLAVDVNVAGALNVIQACASREVGLTKITMPFVNPSVYAATHHCSHRLAEAYRISRGLSVSYVRPYNAFGPGQAWGIGHPQKIIPTFAVAALRGEPLPVWGDGSLPVDLVHVDDVARMLVDAMPHRGGRVFDAGTGVAWPVIGVARMVWELAGRAGDVPIRHLPPRAGERDEVTDDDYAQQNGWDLLGWHPKFRSEDLAATVESYRPLATGGRVERTDAMMVVEG